MSQSSSRRRKRSKPSPAHPTNQSVSKRHKNITNSEVPELDFDPEDSQWECASDDPFSMPPKFSKADLRDVAESLMSNFKSQIVNDLKTELVKELKSEIISVIKSETTKLSTEIAELRRENKQLHEQIKSTDLTLDELDQYGRRMCVEISNIPGDTGSYNEKVEEKVLSLAQRIKLDLSAADIDRCHRLGRRQLESNRRIIVKFTNSKARQRVYDARKSLGDGIYVQDHLTKLRGQLAYEARQLVRSKCVAKTWVAGSKVYIQLNDGTNTKVQIQHMDDIATYRTATIPPSTPHPMATPTPTIH